MSEVKVQFLGSGDAFGSGGRFQTCIYVQAESTRFLIDCGASSLIAMKRFGVEPSTIDQIVLTHLHGDHFGGLPFLIRETQILSKRTNPLTIAGPRGLEERIRGTMEMLFPGSAQVRQTFPLKFVELPEQEAYVLGPLRITAYPAIHTPGTAPHSVRVECAGKVISYSGDTQWSDALLEVAKDTDLFVCESFFFEKEVKNHLSYRTLMAHRSQLSCRRLIITHMSDEMLSQLEHLETEWAEDGLYVVL